MIERVEAGNQPLTYPIIMTGLALRPSKSPTQVSRAGPYRGTPARAPKSGMPLQRRSYSAVKPRGCAIEGIPVFHRCDSGRLSTSDGEQGKSRSPSNGAEKGRMLSGISV